MTESQYRGRFLWYELMTTDSKAAQTFYTKAVGWGLMEWKGTDTSPYVMWCRGETPIGGVMTLPDEARKMGAPPHWMPYIGTLDVDGTCQQATTLGAAIYVPPTDIPMVGRFAVLADPQGATFAVFTPSSAPATASGAPQIGDFSWHELVTTDHVAAYGFYHALVGWEKSGEHDMGQMGLYQMYGRHGHTLGGMFNKPKEMAAPPHWLLYVRVGDVRAAAAAVTAHGGKILHGPVEVPGGDWIVQCQDPQGGVFALHQRKAE
jgi:predicted enzyme related to lactoylglutathione lyase